MTERHDDRELLEKAAKAAGFKGEWDTEWIRMADRRMFWNPLDDDGQALRLAVKLRLSLIPIEGGGWDVHQYDPESCIEKLLGTDNDAKRAITRAAAALGDA